MIRQPSMAGASFIGPMFRTVMEPFLCCAGRDDCSGSSSAFFADGCYAGEKMALVVWRTGGWKVDIGKRSDAAGIEIFSRNRHLARDFERYASTAAAFIRLAMLRIILRRFAANFSS
jgi:hypothetical protein